MAEAKKAKAEPSSDVVDVPAPSARAAESSDPAVHALMAEHQTAVLNSDGAAAEAVVGRLNALGFSL